jgi:hypothetical protein
MDAPDDEHTAFLLNLAYGFRGEAAIAGRNTARLQRAPKRASQSTCDGSNHVVKRGGVWLLGTRIYPVPLCHLRVQPEDYRLCFYWQVGTAQPALQTLDADY